MGNIDPCMFAGGGLILKFGENVKRVWIAKIIHKIDKYFRILTFRSLSCSEYFYFFLFGRFAHFD
jgi:hypothetical protein